MSAVVTERIRTNDEVIADLLDAIAIVDNVDPPDDLRLQTFIFAMQGVSQRTVRAVGAGVMLGNGQLQQ